MAGQEHEPGGLAPESGLLVTASHQLSLRSECPPISDITQYVLEDKSHLSTLFPKPQAQCLAQYVLTDNLMNKRLGKEETRGRTSCLNLNSQSSNWSRTLSSAVTQDIEQPQKQILNCNLVHPRMALGVTSSPNGSASPRGPGAELLGTRPVAHVSLPGPHFCAWNQSAPHKKRGTCPAARMLVCGGESHSEDFPERPCESAAQVGTRPGHVTTEGGMSIIEI